MGLLCLVWGMQVIAHLVLNDDLHLGHPTVILKKIAAFLEGGNEMNQRDGFASGFLAGTLVGGIVGGVIGALVASGRANMALPDGDGDQKLNPKLSNAKNSKGKRRQLRDHSSEVSIEAARRSLEDKIAQLNETIDEVRLTLGNVNRNLPEETIERPFDPES